MATEVENDVPEALRRLVAERVAARDLGGALAAVRESDAGSDRVADLAAAIARLVHACERMGDAPGLATGYRTLAMDDAGLALLHLRMGNLAEAEGQLREIAERSPSDHVSRQRLDDLVLLKSIVASSPSDAPRTNPADPPDVGSGLDKRRKPSSQRWKPANTRAEVDDTGRSTEVIRPETNAELLLRAGLPERALELYTALLAKYPDRADWRLRVAEIEAMLPTSEAADLSLREPDEEGDERPTIASDPPPRAQADPSDPWARDSGPIPNAAEPTQVEIRPIVRVG